MLRRANQLRCAAFMHAHHLVVVALGCISIMVVASGACRQAPFTGHATLAVITDLVGTVAPCGCTSRPLGGLDRIAQRLEEEAHKTPVATFAVGNTLFAPEPLSETMQGHGKATAQTIVQVLAGMPRPQLAGGPKDFNPLTPKGQDLPKALGATFGPQAQAHPGRLITLGDVVVGVLTVDPCGPGPQTMQLNQWAEALRHEGAQGVVLLWPWGTTAAQTKLSELTEVDIVVAGNEGQVAPPVKLGSATLIDGGARGEYLGLIRVQRGTGGRWQFFDGGQAAIAAAQARRDRMLYEAKNLPEGPAQRARLDRAKALTDSLPQLRQAEPTSAMVKFELVAMEMDLGKAAWASQVLDRYNTRLCAINQAETGKRTCLEPRSKGARYVGSGSCQGCHPAAWAVYQTTQHAKAWSTLTTANKACDLSCVGCHVVGFEQPGGFCHLADAPTWANVGCESCHGPGSGHVANPYERTGWANTFVRDTPQSTCIGCHNSTHSDKFDFATYRPKILGPGHGLPMKQH